MLQSRGVLDAVAPDYAANCLGRAASAALPAGAREGMDRQAARLRSIMQPAAVA